MKEILRNIKTPSDVKFALGEEHHFFSRKTMKFFGDKMSSFGVRWFGEKRVIYRKPQAMVNVFGNWKLAGRDYFRAWELVVDEGALISLAPMSDAELDAIFSEI